MVICDDRVLLAYDCSGSTGHDKYYYGLIKQLLAQHPTAEVLAWDDKVVEVPQAAFTNDSYPRAGDGTCPSVICPYILRTQFAGHLIILTDGEVDNSEVDKLDRDISRLHIAFTRVTAHFVKIGRGVFNVAVTAPFTRNCPHEIIHHVQGLAQAQLAVTEEDFGSLSLLDSLQTQEEFFGVYEALERAVVARTMRREKDTALHDKITRMQKRVTANRSKSASALASASVEALVDALGRKQELQALAAAKRITSEYYTKSEDPFSFGNAVSRLLSFCGGALRTVANHSDIASNRARAAIEVPSAELPDEPVTDFEDPIMLDADAPALMIKQGTPLLEALNSKPKLLERVLNNPLAGIYCLMDGIQQRLDRPIGANFYGQSHIELSPMTREPLLDIVVFGKSEESRKYTNRTMARILSKQGLKLGNMDLWFAVFLEAIERTPYLTDILEAAKDHMRWRLMTQQTYASLTGLSQYVSTRMPLGACCWYVITHSIARDPDLPSSTDTTRVHADYIDQFVKLCEIADYRVPEKALKHAQRLAALFSLLAVTKREGKAGFSSQRLLELAVQALYQGSVEVGRGMFFPVDGPATADMVDRARESIGRVAGPAVKKLSLEELVALAGMVNRSLSAVDISLPTNFTAPPLPPFKEGWVHLRACPSLPVLICPLTCRPYYHVQTQVGSRVITETWLQAATRYFSSPLFCDKKLFGRLVCRLNRYPTEEELATALFSYYVERKKEQVLPRYFLDYISGTLNDYKEVMETVSAQEFKTRYANALRIKDRVRIEAR